MSTDVQLPENLSSYASSQRQRHHSANSDESGRSGSPASPKPASLNANSLAASALMLQQMYPHFQDRRLLGDEHQSPPSFNAAALCDQFCNVINGFRGGGGAGGGAGSGGGAGGGAPNFQDPRKSPGVPCSRPSVDATECRLIDYRGEKVAAFAYQGDYLLCLPQAFELFLKHLVGGLHTVYAKLKRLGISPIVCNVEQVRVLRGLGAIQPGVNRCKLLACKDFDVLYKDCTAARPGRPPGRALVGLSGVGATSPAGHGYPPLLSVKGGSHASLSSHSGNPFEHSSAALDQGGVGGGSFADFRSTRDGREGDDARQQHQQSSSERQSPQDHSSGRNTHSSDHSSHLKQESRGGADDDAPGSGVGGLGIGGNPDADGMNIQAMLFKAMWNQGGPGAGGDSKGQTFPPGLALANLPGSQQMNPAMAAAMASQMDLMLGLQHNPQIAAAAAAAYQRQLLQAASLAQHMKGGGGGAGVPGVKENGFGVERNRSRSPDAGKKDFRGSRQSESPAAVAGTGAGGVSALLQARNELHHQSRKSSFESSKKVHHHNNNNSINSGSHNRQSPPLDGNALNLSSGSKSHKKRSRSVSSNEGSLSDSAALSELSGNLDDDTSNYGDDDELEKPRSPKNRDRDDALSTSSRDSGTGVVRSARHSNGIDRHVRDSNHSVPTPITLMQQHLSVDRTPPPSSPTNLNTRLHGAGMTPNTGVTHGGSVGSIEALLQNILGLLKVAEENARVQEQQMNMEKAELKVEILRERGIREQLEKRLMEEQQRRVFYQKRLRREKRCRRQMQEQLDSASSPSKKRAKLASGTEGTVSGAGAAATAAATSSTADCTADDDGDVTDSVTDQRPAAAGASKVSSSTTLADSPGTVAASTPLNGGSQPGSDSGLPIAGDSTPDGR